MNAFLASGLQCPVNVLNGSAQASSVPVLPGSLAPVNFNSPLQTQALDFQKALSIGILQQQFLQNYAFVNSTRFHPRCLRSRPSRSVSQPNLCDSIQQEIFKQLGGTYPDSSGSTPSTSTREPSPIPEEESSEKPRTEDSEAAEGKELNNVMHARGVKRHLTDHRPSPYQKRHRSEERDLKSNQLRNSSVQVPAGILQTQQYDEISQTIWKFYQERQQAQDLYIQKMKLRDALYAVMKGVFPYCGLYVVGSSMNGFGSHSSDMDMCLMLSHCEIDQKKEATEILAMVYKALGKCTFLKDLKLIRAKVPILKFSDRISDVECDLNINNSVGIRNTHLLNSYSKMDWRISPLIVFIKHWAKTHSINDASQGTISSYSLVLMLIHYLQCGCTKPVVPSLQQKYPHKYSANVDIRLLTLNEKLPPYQSPNKESLGELFVGFLHYFANIFSFEHDAMSVRMGTTLSREVVKGQNPIRNPPNQWKCLCIEEPFDLSNTARSVYDPYIFQRILRVFRQSYARVRQTGNVVTILNQPI